MFKYIYIYIYIQTIFFIKTVSSDGVQGLMALYIYIYI